MKQSEAITRRREDMVASVLNELGTVSQFLTRFNPDKQKVISANADAVFSAQHIPSLVRCTYAYGMETMADWLSNQLSTILKMLPDDKRMGVDELKRIAYDILSEPQFKVLRVPEIMLFISQFRTGRFGKVYGTLTSLDICTALREFCKVRDAELAKIEKQKEREERERHQQTAITWEEYCRRKGLDPQENPISKIKL